MDNLSSSIDNSPSTPIHGFVVKTHSGFYTVQTPDGLVVCQLRGTLKQASKKTELCVIGDRVIIELTHDTTDVERGVIKAVLPRERVLSRVEPAEYAGRSTERQQVLIANLDQAIFVFAATKPDPNTRLLDRFIVAAEQASIPSIVIVVNKADLATEAVYQRFAVYKQIGYTLLYTSAQQNQGLETLRHALANKISIMTGPSGVGKSSLLNAIQPGLGRAIGAVSDKLTKGRHTTVNAELIPLAEGGYVADTPGIRTLSLWDIEPTELDNYFREFRPYITYCAFSDCTHDNEPNCAVVAAVESGLISPERHDSYLRLRGQLDDEYIY